MFWSHRGMLSRHSEHLPKFLNLTTVGFDCALCTCPASCTRMRLSLSDSSPSSIDTDQLCDVCARKCTGLSNFPPGTVLVEIQAVTNVSAVERVLHWGYSQQPQAIPNEPLFLHQVLVVAEALGFRHLRALCIDRVLDLGTHNFKQS